MKRIIYRLIAVFVLLSGSSWAQSPGQTFKKTPLPKPPQPPASFVTFVQRENAKRAVFNKQSFQDRDAFLKAHPDVESYLEKHNPPRPPSSWTSYIQQDDPKRAAFENQLTKDRNAFISAHPDVQTFLNQIQAYNKTRIQAMNAARLPKKTP